MEIREELKQAMAQEAERLGVANRLTIFQSIDRPFFVGNLVGAFRKMVHIPKQKGRDVNQLIENALPALRALPDGFGAKYRDFASLPIKPDYEHIWKKIASIVSTTARASLELGQFYKCKNGSLLIGYPKISANRDIVDTPSIKEAIDKVLSDLGLDAKVTFVSRYKSPPQFRATLQNTPKPPKPPKPQKQKKVNAPSPVKFHHSNLDFYKSKEWRMLRYSVIVKYGARCMACGATPQTGAVMNVDHIKPISLHPELKLDANNLQVLCDACNHGKYNIDQTDWRHQ